MPDPELTAVNAGHVPTEATGMRSPVIGETINRVGRRFTLGGTRDSSDKPGSPLLDGLHFARDSGPFWAIMMKAAINLTGLAPLASGAPLAGLN